MLVEQVSDNFSDECEDWMTWGGCEILTESKGNEYVYKDE